MRSIVSSYDKFNEKDELLGRALSGEYHLLIEALKQQKILERLYTRAIFKTKGTKINDLLNFIVLEFHERFGIYSR